MAIELPKEWLTTYVSLTAEAILAHADVKLPPDLLGHQLALRDSFYAGLVKLPARITFNCLIEGQCRDIQKYSQERLIEYIVSGVEQKMKSAPELELKDKLEKSRLKLIDLGAELNQLQKTHEELLSETHELQKKQASLWEEEIDVQINKIWDTLQKCKPNISIDTMPRLEMLMKTQAAGVVISEKLSKKLKLQSEHPFLKAILQLFAENLGTNDNESEMERLFKQVPCETVIEVANRLNEEMYEQQKTLETERNPLFAQVEEGENALIRVRQNLIDLRNHITELLLQASENENAFQASPDVIIVNQEMDVNLSLATQLT